MAYYFVYILKCSDSSLYTGYTTNLPARLVEHNTGKNGAKYTRSRRPVKLVYSQVCRTLSSALKREAAIKQITRKAKLSLIAQANLPRRRASPKAGH